MFSAPKLSHAVRVGRCQEQRILLQSTRLKPEPRGVGTGMGIASICEAVVQRRSLLQTALANMRSSTMTSALQWAAPACVTTRTLSTETATSMFDNKAATDVGELSCGSLFRRTAEKSDGREILEIAAPSSNLANAPLSSRVQSSLGCSSCGQQTRQSQDLGSIR